MGQSELYEIIKANPEITQAQLGKKTGLNKRRLHEQVQGLENKGKIRKTKFKNTYRLHPIANVGRSDSSNHRTRVKDKVKEAMTQNPHLDLRGLSKIVRSSMGTIGPAYHQFKRGEL